MSLSPASSLSGASAHSPAGAPSVLLPDSAPVAMPRLDAATARRWFPVVLLAALLASADGFELTALRGAIGSVEHTQSPFTSWWHASAFMLPVFVAAVAVPLARVRHRTAAADLGRRSVVLVSGLLVAVTSTILAVLWAGATSLEDYLLQTRLLEERVSAHAGLGAHGHALTVAQSVHDRHATLATQVLGLEQAVVVLLVTNLLLVAWFALARGGRLDV